MKRFIIIYEKDKRKFTYACDALDFVNAIRDFEAKMHFSQLQIISIDVIQINS
jgi:hypothetical protein